MSRILSVFLVAAWALAATAAPAQAGPLVAAVTAFFASSPFLAAVGKLLLSVALSKLQAALAPKPKQPGIKTEGTASGSQNPASFILGMYATNGVAVCPPMSHSNGNGPPNRMLTYVIELADIPGHALNAVIINGERCTLSGTPFGTYGFPVVGGTYNGQAWVKFYDGTQVAADPMLLARYASYPQRPWTSAMVGRDICYAIITFRYNRKVYTQFPTVRFEMLGIPLYDPRKDTTVGGSGAHRLNNPATWERTNNPIIMVYNIHLGIALPGGYVWGGGMAQGDIPLASVFAAANACDALVDNGLGGTEPRFRAGYEVFTSEEPADVCEELLKTCLGEAADVAGFWKFQAGDPELPVFLMTDDDVLTTLGRERQPFPSVEATRNGITASFPDPAVQWEPTEAPPVYNATWEAQDGGRRRLVNVDFNAAPYLAQVQRNMRALIADDRRFLTHGVPLPPEATVLEPLDTLSWTSAAYGYAAKTFEVVSTQESLTTGVVQVQLRERDPADTAVPPGYFSAVNTPSTVPVIFAAQDVPGFAVSGTAITGSAGEDRRPAISMVWDASDLEGIPGIEFEIRRATTIVVIAKGTTTDIAAAQLIVSEGILPNTAYEARMKLVSDRDTNWTAWTAVTSPDVPITRPDIANGAVSDEFSEVLLGPFTVADTPSFTVVPGSTISLGAIGNGEIWRRAIHFDIRFPSTGGVTYLLVVQLRGRELGGAFSAWEDLDTFSAAVAAANVWEVKRSSGGFSGNYDELQYRLVCRTQPSGPLITSGYQWLRNYYFAAARVTK